MLDTDAAFSYDELMSAVPEAGMDPNDKPNDQPLSALPPLVGELEKLNYFRRSLTPIVVLDRLEGRSSHVKSFGHVNRTHAKHPGLH
jgi:hypothetical protein